MKPGELYRHRNGNVYQIIYIANEPNEDRYKGENGKIWVRRVLSHFDFV